MCFLSLSLWSLGIASSRWLFSLGIASSGWLFSLAAFGWRLTFFSGRLTNLLVLLLIYSIGRLLSWLISRLHLCGTFRHICLLFCFVLCSLFLFISHPLFVLNRTLLLHLSHHIDALLSFLLLIDQVLDLHLHVVDVSLELKSLVLSFTLLHELVIFLATTSTN